MKLEVFFELVKKELDVKNVFYFRAKISPGAAKNEFVQVLDDAEKTVKIKIAAVPEKGKANKEIVKFFGKEFGCACEIVSGAMDSVKLIKLFR